MTSIDLDIEIDTQSFFYEHVVEALDRLCLNVGSLTEFYLVDLLARKAPKLEIDYPLGVQLAECLDNPVPLERFEGYRTLGDSALLLLGFFGDHVTKKGIDRSYVASMGSLAYRATSTLAGLYNVDTGTYDDLSDGFVEFAHVLDEVREMTSLRKDRTILELYSHWKQIEPLRSTERLYLGGVVLVPDIEDNT